MDESYNQLNEEGQNMISTMEVTHFSWAKVYQFKSICFDWHDYCGPTFLRLKDLESKNQQYRPMRDYGLLSQWLDLNNSERERYRLKI